MRRADRLTGFLLLALAGYTIAAGWRMSYWQGRIPGPGFAPIWIGAGLALCALFLLLRRVAPFPARPAGEHVQPEERVTGPTGELMLAAEITAVTIAVVLLIPRVGMMAGVAALLLALIKLLGGSWRSAVATAVILPVAFYMVFVRWLAVPVPKGPWGF